MSQPARTNRIQPRLPRDQARDPEARTPGTIAVSGGYQFTAWTDGDVPAQITRNQPNNYNGWDVWFDNTVPGTKDFAFRVVATCAS